MDDDAAPKQGALAVIPEVYVDLISRVPPGVLVGISLYFLYLHTAAGIKFTDLDAARAALIIAVTVAGGYVIGLLIDSAGTTLRHHCGRRDWSLVSEKYSHLCPAILQAVRPSGPLLSEKEAREETLKHHRQIYKELHEFLKESDLQDRFVLTKMNTEAALCSNLVVAFLIILLLLLWEHGWSNLVHEHGLRNLALGCFLLFVLTALATAHRTRAALERHFACFAVNIIKKEKKSTDKKHM